MKILIINKDLRLGGGTTAIDNLRHGLKKYGVTIDIAIFENSINLTSVGRDQIFFLSNQKKIIKILRPIYFLVFLLKLMFIVPKYDLIFTFERYPAYFNIILSKIFNKKSIIYIINPLSESLNNIYKNKFLFKLHVFLHKIILSLTNLVIVLEKNAKKELVDYFLVKNNKVMIIPFFVDFEKIKILSKDKISDQIKKIIFKKKVIINVGRLHFQKNQDLLIRAFYLVKKQYKKVILLIIGTGEEKNVLKKLIKKLNLKTSVFIIENENNPFKYLIHADVFALSSISEGLPISLLEALYFKLPIVSTDCSHGIRYIITPEIPDNYQIIDFYTNNYGTLVSNTKKQVVKLLANNINYYLNNKDRHKIEKMKRALMFSKKNILPIWKRVLDNLSI